MNTKQIKTVILSTMAVILVQASGWSQESSFNSKFQEASRLQEEGELNQAFMIWKSLAAENPDNGNVNYRAGLAYLNAPNQKSAALPFLERAIEIGINKNWDPISPYENKSPIEVYYHLGRAYHLNYKFDKAQENYQAFIEKAPGKHFLQAQALLGNAQVDNARVLTKNPVEFTITNLGPVVNSDEPEYSPVISIDENALFYTSRRVRPDSSNLGVKDRNTGEYFEDIYASYKNRKGEWQTPELLEINTPDHTATMNVSVDGQTLFLYQDDGGVGNIYESKLVGETWSEPIKMEGVNSSAWETHLALSADGQTAYFVSNRNGGLGGRDIYRVKKVPNGKWGQAENLGATINTPYEEDAVFISPDELTLYFSSQGHNSMGGFDVFSTTLDENGEWTEPVNIGYPINTVDDDVFFVTSADGKRAYYSSVKESGYGNKDIYLIDLPRPQEVRLALLKGSIIPGDDAALPSNILIRVTNKATNETTIFTPRQRDGSFVAILPPCYDYDVVYEIDEKVVAKDAFSIDCESAYQEIYKELLLNPVRIGPDGTASIISGDEEGTVVVASTGGDRQPANFKRYFGYNETKLSAEEDIFKNFMFNLRQMVERQEKADITILGSASTVPTKTYGSNQNLANERAEETKRRILEYANNMGIDTSKLSFKEVKGEVQGPKYGYDATKNKSEYRKYQYVEINAR